MSVSIAFIVEGKTEKAFVPFLRAFLETRLAGRMPRIKPQPRDGRIPIGHKLRNEVRLLLKEYDHVIALTDVYTGTKDFVDSADAKEKMGAWVGESTAFHPHAAQYDFEAWLLPYWPRIQQFSGYKGAAPPGDPEKVNHLRPPSKHVAEAFRLGGRRGYVKGRDVEKILEGADLTLAIQKCDQLRELINTFLVVSGTDPI